MLFESDIIETNEVSDLSEDSLFGDDMLDFDIDMFNFSEVVDEVQVAKGNYRSH